MIPAETTRDELAMVVRALRTHHREHVDVSTGRDLAPSCPWCRLWHAWCKQDLATMDALAAEFENEDVGLDATIFGTTLRMEALERALLPPRRRLHDLLAAAGGALRRTLRLS